MFDIKKNELITDTEKLCWNILQELREIKELLKHKTENKPSVKEDDKKCITVTPKKSIKNRKR
ncbi:MAG: hypothetical protein ACM3O3_05275 [Syntrophothermus sp.]